MTLRFGSLFAGIGGFDLGLERAGMQCLWQVDNDLKCLTVLKRHWPDVARYEDVRDCGRHNLEAVDLICGGFPCQDLSVAGRREGLAGERSGLWFEFHRVLEELRPRWVVVENVPGLLSSSGGRDFAILLQGLAELRYGVIWRVLDAQYFGVAQRRRRVFIIGHLRDGCAAEVLLERESGAGDPPPSREAEEGTAAPLKASSPSRRRGGSSPIAGEFIVAGLARCVDAREGMRQDPTAETMVINWQSGGDCRIQPQEGLAHPLQASQTQALVFPGMAQSGAGWAPPSMPIDQDRSGPLDTKRQQCVALAISENQRAELRLTPYSRQITSGGGKPGQGYPCVLAFSADRDGTDAGAVVPTLRHGGDEPEHHGAYRKPAIASRFGVRRLTPTECERLQGFPDGWTAGQADSHRYRQLGNAVCVNVAEWIGQRILAVEGSLHKAS